MIEIEIPEWLIQCFVTGIILPIIYFPINNYLSIKFKNDRYIQGKNAYKNFLMDNSEPIEDLFYKLDKYKHDTMMKDFWFFEGIPLGSFFSLFLFIYCITLSQINIFNKFIFFMPYYNYFYNGYKEIDLLYIVLSLNGFSIITVVIICLLLIILESKGYTGPQLTEKMTLKKWSKYVYYSYWFSTGILIGLNLTVIFFTIWFIDIIIRLIKTFPNLNIYVTGVYLISFFISLGFMGIIFRTTKKFSNNFKQTVTNFYIDNFPHIRIKTNGEEISGKINDIHNESLIILNEGCTTKAIRWDQITTMEIDKNIVKNKITMKPLPNVIEKKPWWKFW